MFGKTIALTFFAACYSASAQDAPAHSFRILPVGDPPPFVQEVRDGVRYEMAPRKGTLPPRELKASGIDPKHAEETQLIQPRLGRISRPFSLPVVGENKRLSLISDEGQRWLNLGTKPGGESLVLAWRTGKYWDQISYLEIPQEGLNKQAASVHFANLTSLTVGIIFGQERIRLESGKVFTRSLGINTSPVHLEILIPNSDGKLTSIFANQIEPIAPSFRVVAVYVADGVKPRTPIKVLHAEELYE